MPQPRSRRAPASVRWIAGPGLGLGATGVAALLAWERPLGLSHGPLFWVVVGLTAACGALAVVALLRWTAMDRRARTAAASLVEDSRALDARAGAAHAARAAAARAAAQDPRELARRVRLASVLPAILLALALLVCLGLSALFFLVPTNDDDPWVPWAGSALVFVALAYRPIRMFARVRRLRRDAAAAERADGRWDIR